MNRFNRNLTINIAQDTNNTHQTPSRELHDKQYLIFDDQMQSDEEKDKNQDHKINFIEFQQFNVSKSSKPTKGKIQYNIQIPDSKGKKTEKQQKTILITHRSKTKQTDEIKEPPAPSKGSTKSKIFVFPTNKHEPRQYTAPQSVAQTLRQQFQLERQQFYKEKAKYEKELIIKEGQIEMLQKLITDKIGYKKNAVINDSRNLSELENILVQKDIQITELLEKINQLNQKIQTKSEQLNKVKFQNMHLATLLESMKNQLYIYDKKEVNENLSKQFYQIRNQKIAQRKWNEDSPTRVDFGLKNIQDVQKRLQYLKRNRIQLQQRGKIHSEMSGFSQTSKNKTKRNFDFKGKVYDQKSLMY